MTRIVGVEWDSFTDWSPNHCVTLFTGGCNFKCPYCQNPDVVNETTGQLIPIWEITDKIDRKWVQHICISGGEPTIWETLPNVCRTFKQEGFKIKLDTNGSNFNMLLELINFNLVDYVAMDVKAPFLKYNTEHIGKELQGDNLLNISDSVLLLKRGLVDYEFRTTVVPGLHTEQDIENIAWQLQGAKRYFIQNFWKNAKHLDPKYDTVTPFSKEQIERFIKIAEKYIPSVGVRNIAF